MAGRIYIGVDPGASGGLAALKSDGTVRLMPVSSLTLHDTWYWFEEYRPSKVSLNPLRTDGVFAILEKVGGYVGGAHARGSHMFTFGASFGGLRMCLVAAGVPFETTTPQVWQKAFGMRRDKGEADGAWKNRLKAKAQQLFPQERITLATADALLMAEYCRRKREGTL